MFADVEADAYDASAAPQLIDELRMHQYDMIRSEDLIISESLAQDFCSSTRRGNRRIAGYATVSTTQMTDKKTSQEADIIKSSLLNARRVTCATECDVVSIS